MSSDDVLSRWYVGNTTLFPPDLTLISRRRIGDSRGYRLCDPGRGKLSQRPQPRKQSRILFFTIFLRGDFVLFRLHVNMVSRVQWN